ncbi:MAG: zinc-binding dehydrogenase [Actinomycetota bacterium]|nr:zinc-binding dehydrogenase [Actinomycetota bacterium]
MRAVELQRFGGPAGLVLAERADPEPGPGDVRVDLVAAALNHRDRWIRIGGKAELPAVLGSDGVGVVGAIGRDVDGVGEGDEVVINPALEWGGADEAPGPRFRILGVPDQGTHAERIVVPADHVRPRPERLSWIEAAALPLAGLTAWRAVVTHAAAAPGRTILVPGAGGGVATFAIQLAAALGARVVVTSGSGEKLERARMLGADDGADYGDEDWPEQVGPVDAVIDGVGAPVWAGALRALRHGGRLVNFGDTARAEATVNLAAVFFKELRIQGTTMGSPREFDALLAHVAEAAWRPVIDSVYPLAEAPAAHARLESRERFGKVVLAIDERRLQDERERKRRVPAGRRSADVTELPG